MSIAVEKRILPSVRRATSVTLFRVPRLWLWNLDNRTLPRSVVPLDWLVRKAQGTFVPGSMSMH